jgi:poly(hydroxyalkanoate) depolymerase family esterase
VRSLGRTISSLSRHRRQWERLLQATRKARPEPRSPHEGSGKLTEIKSFGSNPGALRMFTHVPTRLAPTPALVVVLHGCTQTAAGYDLGAGWSTLADRYGFVLLLPEQQTSNNPNTCFNWFEPDDIARDSGEALSIRQMIERMIVDHGIDRRRVFVTGLSAGGAMTAVMLATYPDVFAAGAIIAGLPYGTATNIQQAFESMFNGRDHSAREWGDLVRRASPHDGPWPRVSVWHGDCDSTVKLANADCIVRQWTNVHGIQSPPLDDVVDGYPRQVWRKGAVDVIESYTITGMAHGTPLGTRDCEGQAGIAGAYLLDVGISSSYHIAKFFGLTGGAHAPATADKRVAANGGAAVLHGSVRPSIAPDEPVEVIPDDRIEILDADTGSTNRSHDEAPQSGPLNISAIITKALTAAGLMKPRA